MYAYTVCMYICRKDHRYNAFVARRSCRKGHRYNACVARSSCRKGHRCGKGHVAAAQLWGPNSQERGPKCHGHDLNPVGNAQNIRIQVREASANVRFPKGLVGTLQRQTSRDSKVLGV